jgi:hypothetical protein
MVTGKLEVDGASFFDSTITAANTITATTYVSFGASINDYGGLVKSVDDGLQLLAGHTADAGNRNIIITSTEIREKDHDHDTLSANPTLFIHSVTNPDSDNTQWGSQYHDTGDYYLTTGKGRIILLPVTGSPVQIGDAGTTGHTLNTNDDLYVSGRLEIDGITYLDATSYFASTSWHTLVGFGTGDLQYYGGIARAADDGTHFLIGYTSEYGNRNLIFTSSANYNKDHDHDTQSVNPTIFLHSSTDPDSDNTQWLSLSHDTSKAVASCGKGDFTFAVDIDATGGFTQQLSYWYQNDVAAEQSAVVLNMDGNTSRAEVPTVRAGSVIGIAVYSNEARSAGTATFQVTVDGTAITGHDAVLDGSATQTKCVTIAKNEHTFTAGQRIGIKVTTTADWAPTTADVTVVVLIEQ